MALSITPLTANFGAEIAGTDVNALTDEAFAGIRRAFEENGIVLFRDAPMDDDQQVVFSERFGPLETTVSVNPAVGTPFARQSNIDMATGEALDPDDQRIFYQKGNMHWHADSTFKKTPSLCSVLTAREVPPEGGATEFCSTQVLYETLDAGTRDKLDGCIVEHDFAWSRARFGFVFSDAQRAENPPARHPLVQVNPVTGKKSLMIGAHAKCIVGWPETESRALLDDMLERATDPAKVYVHHWRTGDAVVWDNRATLHRATPFDVSKHRRLMQRTTISNPSALAEYGQYADIGAAH